MELNESESYIEEFDSSDSPGRQSIFPSKPQIIIYSIIFLILLIFLEKLFIKIFFFFIPSYFFTIITMLLINYFLLIYFVYTCIYKLFPPNLFRLYLHFPRKKFFSRILPSKILW